MKELGQFSVTAKFPHLSSQPHSGRKAILPSPCSYPIAIPRLVLRYKFSEDSANYQVTYDGHHYQSYESYIDHQIWFSRRGGLEVNA